MIKNLTIVIEKGDDNEIWGSIEAPGFFYSTVGRSVDEITDNLRQQVDDFLAHEGETMPEWDGVSVKDISFDYEYDLTALFEVFNAIKINSIADLAGINKGLVDSTHRGLKRVDATSEENRSGHPTVRRTSHACNNCLNFLICFYPDDTQTNGIIDLAVIT